MWLPEVLFQSIRTAIPINFLVVLHKRTNHSQRHIACSPARTAPCSTPRLHHLSNPCQFSNSIHSDYPAILLTCLLTTLPFQHLLVLLTSQAFPSPLAILTAPPITHRTPPLRNVSSLCAREFAASHTRLHALPAESRKIAQEHYQGPADDHCIPTPNITPPSPNSSTLDHNACAAQ